MPINDADKGAFAIVRAPHGYPPATSSQAFRLERDDCQRLPLFGGDMDRIYDTVDDDIDPVGIGGADVVAELLVAVGPVSSDCV